MREYPGELVGGPDNGNVVRASQDKIPVISTTEMWLDGLGEEKAVTIIEVKGVYKWQADNYFLWEEEACNLYTKKAEAA